MKESLMINRFRKRILKRNKNALILLVGDTGDGKSWAGLRWCYNFDPTFDGSRKRVAHMSAEEFFRVLRHSNLKRGNAIMWDDVGRGLRPEDWFTMVFKIVTDIIQTFRVRGLFVVFTVPDPSLVTKKVQKVFHYQGEMIGIDYVKGYGKMKFFEIQINRRTGKPYYKYPKIRMPDGKIRTVTKVNVKKPPKEMIRVYERDKRKAYNELEAEGEKIAIQVSQKERKKLITDEDIAKRMDEDPKKYIAEYHKRRFVSMDVIMNEFHIGRLRGGRLKTMKEKQWKSKGIL